MSSACSDQPSSKGRRPGHNLLTKESKQAGCTWGKGLESSAQPLDSSQQTECGWRQGLNPALRNAAPSPPRSPSWHRIPHSRLGLHNAAYESKITRPCQPCGQARMGGKKGKERGFFFFGEASLPPLHCYPNLVPPGKGRRRAVREKGPVLLQDCQELQSWCSVWSHRMWIFLPSSPL